MALIECYECHKQVSDKAAACPHCGAPVDLREMRGSFPSAAQPLAEAAVSPPVQPVSAVPVAQPPAKKTGLMTWFVLAVIVVAGFWYLPKTQREASLPSMPTEVKFRPAMTGPGLVLMVKNTSDKYLTFLVTVTNPATNLEKSYRVDASPSGAVEVGYREGLMLSSGDKLKISNSDYQTWNGSIP